MGRRSGRRLGRRMMVMRCEYATAHENVRGCDRILNTSEGIAAPVAKGFVQTFFSLNWFPLQYRNMLLQ
jgi:hypothetical protein